MFARAQNKVSQVTSNKILVEVLEPVREVGMFSIATLVGAGVDIGPLSNICFNLFSPSYLSLVVHKNNRIKLFYTC